MRWVQAASEDFSGTPPTARSGHSAVRVGKSLLVVFGGLVDKKFLDDLIVYDIENRFWFQPFCTGSVSHGHVGPSARAFHVAVSSGCHMFIFGGRYGRKRLGDFWMLDTDTWQWAELTGFGDLPVARDFAAGASLTNGKLVLYGGWDGSKWLSDVYVLDTISLEWRQLLIAGLAPTPRCGHTATLVAKRLLIFGGRGGGGPIMGDLWALKGLFDEDAEPPAWTQLKLPGQVPAARCGHTITSADSQLLVFGGHGTGGWLTRYDVYYNDCIVLDRASGQWKKLQLNSDPPPPRAYHSLTRVGSRFLLIGGYDGKSTFGDLWWLVPEDDTISKRAMLSPRLPTDVPSFEKDPQSSALQRVITDTDLLNGTLNARLLVFTFHCNPYSREQEEMPLLAELRKRLGLPSIDPDSLYLDINKLNHEADRELVTLGLTFAKDGNTNAEDSGSLVKMVREHWNHLEPKLICLRELGPLLRDYQRLIASLHSDTRNKDQIYQFYHIKEAKQLRMDDVPPLLDEYRHLLHLYHNSQI